MKLGFNEYDLTDGEGHIKITGNRVNMKTRGNATSYVHDILYTEEETW